MKMSLCLLGLIIVLVINEIHWRHLDAIEWQLQIEMDNAIIKKLGGL